MSSLFPSPQTTVRSSLDLEIELSSCGTLWATASLPSPTKVTLSGYPASDSRQILKTQSLSVLDGISLSRCVVIFLPETCPGCFAISTKYLLLQSLKGHETNIHQCTEAPPSRSLPKHMLEIKLLTATPGLGTSLLPNSDRPHWPFRLHQHSHHLSRRLTLRIRREGRHNYALGSQRIETSLFAPSRRRNSCPRLLTQQILALRCYCIEHHNLRPREEEQG